MNPATLERLEFPQLKELLAGRLTCAPGRRALAALAPSRDRGWIAAELERVAEARLLFDDGEEMGFGDVSDPEAWLVKLGVQNAALAPEELLNACSLLNASTRARQALGQPRYRDKLPRLRELAAALRDFTSTEKDIRRRILPGGEIDDHASPTLAELRKTIHETEAKLHRTLKRVQEEAGQRGALQDEFVTLRGGRLVLPVRSDARERPEGVVHAASGTGQTLYLEPLATIALNNELVRLREDEALEIRRILLGLTDQLARRRPELEQAASAIGALDLLFARARYARDFHCALPSLNSDGALHLTAVRHPLLEAALKKKFSPAAPAAGEPRAEARGLNRTSGENEVVPISVNLADGQRVLVISGPNAGGKTAALKTVGLAAVAAQAGIPVPAEDARLPVFEHILADIGDEQSLVENLSTFSAHIVNLKEMAGEANERALVLLDELGAATSPEEGAALGIALLEHFRRRQALTIATTHHERLKAYAASTPGAVNAAVEFDEVNLRPTYRLLLGMPGVSSGLEMAARLGLPSEIVDEARKKITTEVTETTELIRQLHQTQQELERLQEEVRAALKKIEEEREGLQQKWLQEQRKRLAELEKHLNTTLAHYHNEMRVVINGLSNPKLRERLEKVGTRQLARVQGEMRHEFDTAVVQHLGESARKTEVKRVKPEELVPGARVKLRGIARRGVILTKLDENLFEVQMGSLRMKAKGGDVESIEKAKGNSETRKSKLETRPAASTATELDLRGMRVEEAVEKTDKFLDESVLSERSEVRVIHGLGTGALKKALTEFLAEHPHVESTREADREKGGAGVTVIVLRRSE
ncbi:MAG: endonuclease MutS2 [Acidobacteria bacterium]|nr:endonuclease MutS2 [Acidobacteriota bacterium]